MPLNHATVYSELTDAQFAMIGRIVVEWTNIESLLGVILSRLLFTPEFLGRVYTDEITGSRRQAALKKALEVHEHRYGNRILPEQTASKLAALNAEIEQLRSARNRFAHFCWSRSTDDQIFGTGFTGTVPPVKASRKNSVVLSTAELQQLYRRSYAVVERLSALISEIPEVGEQSSFDAARR